MTRHPARPVRWWQLWGFLASSPPPPPTMRPGLPPRSAAARLKARVRLPQQRLERLERVGHEMRIAPANRRETHRPVEGGDLFRLESADLALSEPAPDHPG